MKGKHIFILLAIVGAVAALVFHKDLQAMLDGESSGGGGFTIGKVELPVEVQFSVIRYNGKPVSAVAIGNPNDELTHFVRIDEENLKKTMGVENYYENKNFIDQYRGERIQAAYIPSRGGFSHKVEKLTIKLE
ncbi:MAG: hypothetical protein P8J32_09215 [bacterium]|nr:hypothetical protein [bacterium]